DLQLPDLPVQIVNDLLRIPDRRRPVAARKQFARTRHQLLLPVADHRRDGPQTPPTAQPGSSPPKAPPSPLAPPAFAGAGFEFRAVLLPLYAHVSRPFGPLSL